MHQILKRLQKRLITSKPLLIGLLETSTQYLTSLENTPIESDGIYSVFNSESRLVKNNFVDRIPKWWGEEKTYYNNTYCCKVLQMNKDGATSMHFHLEKHETLYVAAGHPTIIILYNKAETKYELEPGDAFVMAPGTVHKIIASVDDVIIVEASTKDKPTDSYRVS